MDTGCWVSDTEFVPYLYRELVKFVGCWMKMPLGLSDIGDAFVGSCDDGAG